MNLGREDEKTEFKRSTGEMEEAIISIVAMLNKHHEGTLYFGVNNDGEVIGQQIGESTTRDIAQNIGLKIEPKIFPNVFADSADGKDYIIVTFKGKQAPYATQGRVYIRTADQNRLASMNEVRRLFMTGESDLLRGRPALQQSLTFESLFDKLKSKGIATSGSKAFLNSAGLLTDEGAYNFQAELLSDQNNSPLLINRFKGRDKSFLRMRDDIGSRPLFKSIDAAMEIVSALNETRITLDGSAQRKETKLFDIAAFREALINAVVHNDWLTLVPPVIDVYDDRIDVVSSGGIPIDMSQETFFQNVSQPVNPSLFLLLSMLGYSERSGHGIEKIVSIYGKEAFSFYSTFLRVSIPFAFRPDWAIGQDVKSLLTDIQLKVFEALYSEPRYSLPQVAKMLGIPLSTVKNAASSLQKKGLIYHVGSKNGGIWKISV